MYQDLRSKLEMYKSNQPKKVEIPKDSVLDIHNLLEGAIVNNEGGSCFVIEKRYPLAHLHGGYSLGKAREIDMSSLRKICSDMDEDIGIDELVFLDTETTGLSSGTGTVAFLVGTGLFEDGYFVLRQYFMRDYNEEPSLLRALNGLLAGRKGLVTFNGKSFDWNLLQTRYTFNRMRPALREPIHIDLLFPARRLWKLKLESCRLSSLEENILGEYRVDDIPGAMIPGIYFKYLEERDATLIKKVITHNELDILSMVSLLVKISTILENPLVEAGCERELLGVGKIFEINSDYAVVIDCYESCMKSDNSFVKESASRRLSDIYKRSKNYTRAVELWERMLGESGGLNLYPMIELAKHYEHREKDAGKALEIVEKAMRLGLQLGLKNSMYHEEIKRRYERLKRKAGR